MLNPAVMNPSHPEAVAAARSMIHPMVDPKTAAASPPFVVERGQGVHVWDSTGKRYLDVAASLWNVNVGHNRREINDAIKDQLEKLSYYSTFGGTSNTPSTQLAARLTTMFGQEKMSKVFFSSGGSDAVESALKLARQYWKLAGEGGRWKFISLKWGYHGVHFGGASLNGNPAFRHPYDPLLPGCFQVESPYTFRNPWNERDPERLASLCLADLESVIQYQDPRTIAAFVAEPVQGAGGVIVPHESYWPGLRRLLDRYGILLISDEVITGFGRIGSLCGARAWGVAPDIMALAKGINSGYVPLGATLLNERVASAFEKPEVPANVMHGYTYSGHPLACAAANANLEIVEREDLSARAADVGGYLLDRLDEMTRYAHVGEVRGKGLMCAIELVADQATRAPLAPTSPYVARLSARSRHEGAILRFQANRVMLSPPLVFSREDVDETMRILHCAFADAEAA